MKTAKMKTPHKRKSLNKLAYKNADERNVRLQRDNVSKFRQRRRMKFSLIKWSTKFEENDLLQSNCYSR